MPVHPCFVNDRLTLKWDKLSIISKVYGSFVLLNTDFDPDLGTDIHPKMCTATIGVLDPDWNPSPVSVQYNVAIWFGIQLGVGIRVRVRQSKCVIILSSNKIPFDTNLMKVLTLQLGLSSILI